MQPTELRLIESGARVRVNWPDGLSAMLTAKALRRESRAAPDLAERLFSNPSASVEGLVITSISLVGRYAVNITFSDGCDRGIYPWSLLRELSETGDAADGMPVLVGSNIERGIGNGRHPRRRIANRL